MSRPTPNLDNFKLETTFGDGFVVNVALGTHPTTDTGSSTWRQERLLGRGAFGSVWLQKGVDSGELRAVKELRKEDVTSMGFTRELLSLITLVDASDPVLFIPSACFTGMRSSRDFDPAAVLAMSICAISFLD